MSHAPQPEAITDPIVRGFVDSAIARGETEWWFGKPDAWFENPTWRCASGHVSKVFLKSEERGDLCLACQMSVQLTDPSDTERADTTGADER